MNKKFLRISLGLNILLALLFTFLVIRYWHAIHDKLFPHAHTDVIMMGDSITYFADWNDLLSNKDVRNEGLRGISTSNLFYRVNGFILPRQPKICFIQGGYNDLDVGIPQDRTIANFERIATVLKENGIVPVLTEIIYTVRDTFKNVKMAEMNDSIRQWAMQNKVEYMALNDVLSENNFLKSSCSVDGVHLNEEAYNLYRTKVNNILSKYNLQ